MVAVAIAKTQWSVTPSLRVAAFSHRNKIGQPVLVDADLKTKLCKHGETSSTIRTWLQLEAQARAEGKDPPSRGTSNGTEARACAGRQAAGATLQRPWSALLIETGPLRHPLALGRHDAAQSPEPPRARACSWHVLGGGDSKGEVAKVTQAVLPRLRRASRARAGTPPGPARASCPARITRRTSWGPCGAKKGLLGRRRPFRAVRHFPQKWATCTPSTLQRS